MTGPQRRSSGATAYYPPGFPLILSGLYWLTNSTPLPDGEVDIVVTDDGIEKKHLKMRSARLGRPAKRESSLAGVWRCYA